MIKKVLAGILIVFALSACDMPDIATSTPSATLRVPPPGYTPTSLAAQAIINNAELSDDQKKVDMTNLAIAESTAISQSKHDDLNFAATQTSATATAQAIAIDTAAKIRADQMLADQQARDNAAANLQATIDATKLISQTIQEDHERAVAFALTVERNEADAARAAETANITTWILRVFVGLLFALILFFVNKILGSVYERVETDRMAAALRETSSGVVLIDRSENGQPTATPLYKLDRDYAPQVVIDQVPDPKPQPIPEVMKDTRSGSEISKGTPEYWKGERACRARAVEFVAEIIAYYNSIGLNGAAMSVLPSATSMKKSGSWWDYGKKIIEQHVTSIPGTGSTLTGKYTTFHNLWSALSRNEAGVTVYIRDEDSKLTPLSPSESVAA